MTNQAFRKIIWDHYKQHRRSMPWRETTNEYHVLVSEIMLQQTQVARVLKFYPRFLKKFPNFQALSKATPREVLLLWQGLGYNRRALALHELSKIIVANYAGHLPRDRKMLESLPGIGRGTSGSLSVFAWNAPEIFIETNIRRVFIHFFFPRRKKVTDSELERYIKRTLPKENAREWYWALMDYGAMLGESKKRNPNHRSAHFKKQSAFKGSDREVRGKILGVLLQKRKISPDALSVIIGEPLERAQKIVNVLQKEGFIKQQKDYITICV